MGELKGGKLYYLTYSWRKSHRLGGDRIMENRNGPGIRQFAELRCQQ